MSACALLYRPATANDQFKLRYPNSLRWSTLVALLLMILLFLLSPRYVPTPYQMPRVEPLEILPVPDFEVPKPPPPAPLIPENIMPAPDDLVLKEIPIPDVLIPFDDIPLRPTGPTIPIDSEIFTPSAADPTLLGYAEPYYPELARMAELEGIVVVNVLVGPDGSVLRAEIQNGAHPLLNKAALEAARKCRFSPGMQRELPVKAWMAIPYRFRLH